MSSTLCKILLIFFISCSIQQNQINAISQPDTIYIDFHSPPDITNLVEGDKKRFEVIFDLPSYPRDCSTFPVSSDSTADLDDFTIEANIGEVILTSASFEVDSLQTVTFTICIVPDGDGAETFVVESECIAQNGDAINVKWRINVAASSQGNGDPHFRQQIMNGLTNETTRICYDVSGKSNDYLYIFSQPKLEIELFGQLKDDYYMHKIILKIENHLVQADVNEIYFSSGDFLFSWNIIAQDDWFEFKGIYFKQNNDTIEVKRYKNDELSFRIMRKKDNFAKYYLDVFVIGLSTDYSGMDGLFGRIGNSKILVYPQVQESNERTTVVVNGRKTFGYKQMRQGMRCTLIKVNDLLYPQRLNDYIMKEIN